MAVDQQLYSHLNTIVQSKGFTFREMDRAGRTVVKKLAIVPNVSGVHWISGWTTAANGKIIESVFKVDTDTSGSLLSAYWLIGGVWYISTDGDALVALASQRNEVFPFDWRYDVPLEVDLFHSDLPRKIIPGI
jgi:hypothetical protein